MNSFDKNYWEERYQKQQTQWDAGEITTPIKEYVDQIADKATQILIPGAGNAHELEYLVSQNFTDVTVIDIALQPLQNISKKIPAYPTSKLIHQDFFQHNQKYDLIIEQTFFCALNPKLRAKYVLKMKELLKPNGKIVGLLFNMDFNNPEPPFGGSVLEYQKLFSPYFNIKVLDPAYNSIKPREGKELFFIFENK